MTLSNCSDCQFSAQACAVNPIYWEIHHSIKGNIPLFVRPSLEALIPDCKDWAAVADLEPLTLSITLTQREWLEIAEARGVSDQIIPQVRQAINYAPAPQKFDEISF